MTKNSVQIEKLPQPTPSRFLSLALQRWLQKLRDAFIIKDDDDDDDDGDDDDGDYDYDDDCKRVGAKWTNVKSKAEMAFAELEADEFDLLLQEAKEPLPNDILTMEELA